MNLENATFHTFKTSGKWAYSGRGYLPEDFNMAEDMRSFIMTQNGHKCPGMSTDGSDLTLVIIPDENHPTGWPLMFYPEGRVHFA